MTRRVFALASAVLLGLSCTPAPVVSADECANVVPKAGEVWTRQDYNFQGGKQDLSKLTCAPGYQFSCNGVAASPATDGDHGGCVDVNLCYHRNGTQFWYPNMALTIGSCIPIECPNVVPKAGEVWTRQDYNFQGGKQDLSKLTCAPGYQFSCNGVPATPATDGDHGGCVDVNLCYHRNGTQFWYPNMALTIGSCIPIECPNVVPKAGEVWTRQDYNFQGGKQDLSKLTCAAGYEFSCNGVAATPVTDGDHGGCVDVNLCYHRNGTQFWYPNMALTIGSCIPKECPNVVPKAGEVWTRQDYNFQGGKQDLSKLTCAPGYQFACNGVAATPVTDGDHGGCVDVNLCYHRNGTQFWYPNMALTIGSCIPIECPDVVPKAGEVWTRQQYNFQGGTKDLSKLTCSAGYTFSCNGSPATPAPDADHYGCSDAYLCYHHNSTSGSGGTTSWYPNMAIAIGSCVSTGAGTLHSINVDGSAVDMTASSSSSSSGVSAMAVGVTVGMLVFLVIASHVVRSYVARRQQQKQVNTIDCMTQQQQQV